MSQRMIKISGPVRLGELIPTPGAAQGGTRAYQAQFYNWPKEAADWKPGCGKKPKGTSFTGIEVTYDRYHRRLIREGSVTADGSPYLVETTTEAPSQAQPRGAKLRSGAKRAAEAPAAKKAPAKAASAPVADKAKGGEAK